VCCRPLTMLIGCPLSPSSGRVDQYVELRALETQITSLLRVSAERLRNGFDSVRGPSKLEELMAKRNGSQPARPGLDKSG